MDEKHLEGFLIESGLQGRLVPITHLADLSDDLDRAHRDGLLDETFYQERLTFFDFSAPVDLPGAKSLVIIAVPRPQTRIHFTWKGAKRSLILPPTFVDYDTISPYIARLLAGWLAPAGYRIAPARVSLKPLAVHSGLGEYGRNNLVYITGMGSFFHLVAFFTDVPCENDPWRELRSMDLCIGCRACMLKCPTGAIREDRFVIRADLCLVFHNMRSPDYPFPAWMEAAAHNCLIGCMLCQTYCPVDRPFVNLFGEEETFDEGETGLLLRGASLEALPDETRARLKRLGLLDSLDILPRNLGVFFR